VHQLPAKRHLLRNTKPCGLNFIDEIPWKPDDHFRTVSGDPLSEILCLPMAKPVRRNTLGVPPVHALNGKRTPETCHIIQLQRLVQQGSNSDPPIAELNQFLVRKPRSMKLAVPHRMKRERFVIQTTADYRKRRPIDLHEGGRIGEHLQDHPSHSPTIQDPQEPRQILDLSNVVRLQIITEPLRNPCRPAPEGLKGNLRYRTSRLVKPRNR